MITKNRTLVALSSAALIGLAVAGGATAFAQTNQGQENVMFHRAGDKEDLAKRLADKLGIEEAKVKSAFDQIQTENQANRQQKMSERLDQLVTDGKLTESQKQAVIVKLEELKANFNPDSFKNMTPDQHMQAMEQKRAELESWATAQGIDLSILPMAKFEMHGGPGMKMKGFHHRFGPDTSPSAKP